MLCCLSFGLFIFFSLQKLSVHVCECVYILVNDFFFMCAGLVLWIYQSLWLLYPPYECTYGGYYGLVVVTPRPQTFHRSHNNLKNPYRIASIFYMYIDMGERIAGKQDGPGPIIYGPPSAPRIAKNVHFCILRPIYEKLAVIFAPCYTYVCSVMRSYCPEIFVYLGLT